MDWNKKIPQWMLLLALPVILLACTVSYKFNGASINYDKVKTKCYYSFLYSNKKL